MGKSMAWILSCLLLMSAALGVRAEATNTINELEVTITYIGEGRDKTAEREKQFEAQVKSPDGSFSQTLSYAASVGLNSPQLASLEDVNFDGHADLVLTVGLGTNEYSIMALWNAEKGCFDAPYQELELCNYKLYPKLGQIGCYEKDGAAYYTLSMYQWEGTAADSLKLVAQGGTYATGNSNTIGERLQLRGSGVWIDWDEQYESDWYAQERVFEERYQVIASCVAGALFAQDAQLAQVANVDWVNLRKQDSKASASLAKLDAGASVRVLANGCGADKNWTRVMTELPEKDGAFPAVTGYIMSRYLKMDE